MFPKSSKYSLLYKINGKYNFYLGDSENFLIYEDKLKNTYFKESQNIPTNIEGNSKLETENKINIFNYQFESEKRDKSSKNTTQSPPKSKDSKFILPTKKIYNVNFSVGQFVMQLNPTFNNLAYQRYSENGFKNAGFDGFTLIQAKMYLKIIKSQLGLKDLYN